MTDPNDFLKNIVMSRAATSCNWAPGVAGWASLRCGHGAEHDRLLAEAIARLEYLTPESRFAGGGRGKPPPHEMTAEQRREIGLERETWQLEVVADPQSDVKIERPLSKELGTALDWNGLMALARNTPCAT